MKAPTPPAPIRAEGSRIIDGFGNAIRLRGVCLGGWLNMENFITGYSGNESLMRAKVREVLGDDRYERFFERLLTVFFNEADAAFLAENGLNVVRIALNYRHIEHDDKPFEIVEDGFRHLDRVIEQCAAHGIYTIIDLHSLPGYQNQHWHCDNPTHVASFWEHPHFQDRVVNMWEAMATRYKDNTWVAGYNLMNEPADETRKVVGPFYKRLVKAVRTIDPDHMLFVDGNSYATEFDIFDEPWENTIYTMHDYVPAGLGRLPLAHEPSYPKDGRYPGRESAHQQFFRRSQYMRDAGTPLMVGEFGPIYTNDEAIDSQRRVILADQLDIYREYNCSWSIWMYKDIGRQGLVYVKPESPYLKRFSDFVAKKFRLGADEWGTDGEGVREVTRPVQDLIEREAPDFNPYPRGRFDWVRTLLLNITIAHSLVDEYALLFRDLDDEELDALADSFAFENCQVREPLLEELKRG
ncbi:MAG: glycoside hydrolase family 5 protein [Rhodoglobus sp.]|nr:glycoside hydrolase family 5 protein [Rhodoglobus sp.]